MLLVKLRLGIRHWGKGNPKFHVYQNVAAIILNALSEAETWTVSDIVARNNNVSCLEHFIHLRSGHFLSDMYDLYSFPNINRLLASSFGDTWTTFSLFHWKHTSWFTKFDPLHHSLSLHALPMLNPLLKLCIQ